MFVGCATTPSSGSPEGRAALINTLSADGRFKTFVKMLEVSELDLPNDTSTLFAPTDEAFASIDQALLDRGLERTNRDKLRTELQFHMVPDKLTSAQLRDESSVETAAGYPVTVTKNGDRLLVGNAVVTEADIDFGFGVVHVIDQPLKPPKGYPKPKEAPKTRRVQPDQWWW